MQPDFQNFKIHELSIKPIHHQLYMPPMVWKGDCVGHVGINDNFFWVLEGECFVNIDSQCFIVRPGQLAYLPKGKMRSYTHSSEKFTMYEMSFSAEVNGQDLMELLDLTESNYVVNIQQQEEMTHLFESSGHHELFKSPVYDLSWCANIINVLRIYIDARLKQKASGNQFFSPVLEYMNAHLTENITTEKLAAIVYMQPTYFIRRFKEAYGMPPITYLGKLRLYKAMNLLSSSSLSIEEVSREIGITDTSYFSRFFRKNCGVTPSEYRSAFRK